MSNAYFQFKQFCVGQQHCAMKVSTDACLLGALAPFTNAHQYLLDIGAGTGLLSLMLAQRLDIVKIDALELDPAAAQEAKKNVTASPWSDRIVVHHADINEWKPHRQYNGIICNPPFFQQHLQSDSLPRRTARHDVALTKQQLIIALQAMLTQEGLAVVLWPQTEQTIWETLATEMGMHLHAKINIRPLPQKGINRVVSIWAKQAKEALPLEQELIIYEGHNRLTDEAAALLRPYYLNL